MATQKPVYRAEIRAPKSELIFTGVSNAAEAAVLAPPASPATPPHRDWFRVATQQVGYGVQFDGTATSFARRSVVNSWPTGNFSFEIWLRVDDPQRNCGIVSYAVSGNFNMFLMFITNAVSPGVVSFEMAGGTGGGNFTNAAIVDGRWHHVAYTRTAAGQGTSFLDGVQQVTSAGTGTAMTAGGFLYLGQEQDGLGVNLDRLQALRGAVDGFKMYARALTPQEVAERFRGIVSNDANKIIDWGFDEGHGFRADDASGNGNHAELLDATHIGETPITWKPYLRPIRGRRGRIDMEGRQLDVGALTLELADVRVPDASTGELSNLKRWWTGFFGDARGKPRGKLKVAVDESLDGGATFSAFATARLVASSVGKTSATLTVHDESEALKMDVFVGPPHSSITYAALPSLMPLGVQGSDYGTGTYKLAKVTPLDLVASDLNVQGAAVMQTTAKFLAISASVNREDNLVTKQLVSSVAPNDIHTASIPGTRYGFAFSTPNFSGTCRARVTWTSGALNGQTGDYKVGGMTFESFGTPRHYRMRGCAIAALDAGDKNQLGLPVAGVTGTGFLFVDDTIDEDNPILLNDVDPVQLLQDLCDGKFGYLWRAPEVKPVDKAYGDPKRTVATNGFAAFLGKYPPARFRIEGREHLIDWVEENILKQYHLALYLDKQGRLNLVDLRLPTSLAGIATLTDEDTVADGEFAWEHDPTSAVTRVEFRRYYDRLHGPAALLQSADEWPELPRGGLVEEYEHPLIVLDIGSSDFGDQPMEIDARGYRSLAGEELNGQSRLVYLENKLVELAGHVRRPWGYGLTTIRIACRRTATVTALVQGAPVLLAVSQVPDPATWKRGGTRLCRVLEISEDGPTAMLELVDLSLTIQATAPALAQPAQETGNTYTGAQAALTVDASGPAEVAYAVTLTSVGSAPADDSPLWATVGLFRTSQTVIIRNVPPGQRVWFRSRTVPDQSEPYFPSAWVLAGGNGRVDTAAISAVSTLVVATKTDRTARLSWSTAGVNDLGIEILLATPVGDPRAPVGSAMMASTLWDLTGLTPNTEYRAEVRFVLGQHHGVGLTVDFTTDSAATAPVAPVPAGFSIVKMGAAG